MHITSMYRHYFHSLRLFASNACAMIKGKNIKKNSYSSKRRKRFPLNRMIIFSMDYSLSPSPTNFPDKQNKPNWSGQTDGKTHFAARKLPSRERKFMAKVTDSGRRIYVLVNLTITALHAYVSMGVEIDAFKYHFFVIIPTTKFINIHVNTKFAFYSHVFRCNSLRRCDPIVHGKIIKLLFHYTTANIHVR